LPKELNVVIAVPTAGMVRMGFAYSLCGLVSRVAAAGCPTRPESSIAMCLDVNESSVMAARAMSRFITGLVWVWVG